MTRAEMCLTLDKMITVNNREREVVKEAIGILAQTEWLDPADEVPADETFVWVLIDGWSKGVEFYHTPAVGSYDPEDGWMLVDYDETDWFTVLAWMPVAEWEGDRDE